GQVVDVPQQSVEPGEAQLTLQLELPPGFKLNPLAPSAVSIDVGGAGQTFRNPKFPLSVPVKISEGDAMIRADFVLYYCEVEKESLCYFREARLSLAVKGTKGANNHRLSATYKLGQ